MALVSAENMEAPLGSLEERFRPGQTAVTAAEMSCCVEPSVKMKE